MDRNRRLTPAHDRDSLLARSLHGDREALGILLIGYRPVLYRLALRFLGNPEDAEDALQDAFLNVFRHLHQFERRSQFSTWLTRVVINAAAMIRRRRLSRPEGFLEERPFNADGHDDFGIADRRASPEQACSSSEIHSLIDELSPSLRSALHLRLIQGLSCAEAGRTLGISVAALKSRTLRARQQLAQSLTQSACAASPRLQTGIIASRPALLSPHGHAHP